MKKLAGYIKNQRGLTLIELLAVVVILGIIAAIAVPSIGGIIANSKKDAHIANAEQMVSSARLAMASDVANDNENDSGDIVYTLDDLVDNGYMEEPENPGADDSYGSDTQVIVGEENDNTTYTIILTNEGNNSHITNDNNQATIETLRDEGREIISVDGA